jgi:hypothetical protein
VLCRTLRAAQRERQYANFLYFQRFALTIACCGVLGSAEQLSRGPLSRTMAVWLAVTVYVLVDLWWISKLSFNLGWW